MKDLNKDFRFILNGYINIINENNLSFCSITDIEILLSDMDKIENYLNKIKAIRLIYFYGKSIYGKLIKKF